MPQRPFEGRPSGFRHHRGGFGGLGFGFGPALIGPDLGFPTDGGATTPEAATDDGYSPPPMIIPAPPPCLPPQIIKIGRGVTQTPRTRVVYGPPRCGAY